jgi:2-isopropylmalate synthase
MILKTRKDFFKFRTAVKTGQIVKTSRLVSTLTGIHIQPNKAIVGDNAFRHEAGIHQDGVLKEKTTYEIINPEAIGLKESKLVLGKHSGRHAFKKRLLDLGHELSERELAKAFERFKRLADKKKEIYDGDLEAIIEDEISAVPETFKLLYIHTTSGSQTVPTATIRLEKKGKVIQDAACGDGPVDAAYKTIDRITGLGAKLIDYSLRAVTSGKDALGEVTVKIRKGGRTITGRGTSTDIIEASAKAYVNAVNKLVSKGSAIKD